MSSLLGWSWNVPLQLRQVVEQVPERGRLTKSQRKRGKAKKWKTRLGRIWDDKESSKYRWQWSTILHNKHCIGRSSAKMRGLVSKIIGHTNDHSNLVAVNRAIFEGTFTIKRIVEQVPGRQILNKETTWKKKSREISKMEESGFDMVVQPESHIKPNAPDHSLSRGKICMRGGTRRPILRRWNGRYLVMHHAWAWDDIVSDA